MFCDFTVLRCLGRPAGLIAAMLSMVASSPATAQPAPPAPAEQLAALDSAAQPPEARAAIAASRAAWQQLGSLPAGRWLLVNIPAFEISLMDGTRRLATWRVIVGKTKTPTPIFTGVATAVILNPWWEIPASIVAESVGAMMAKRPKEAARKGYVRQGDRYRQAPGPDNQLGQMKLEFRNAHSIGIHDTPSRQLFTRDRRAFSHGCIRVDDPMGFAATLLGPPTSRDSLTVVASTDRETQRLALAEPIPVIVGYFTADLGDDGNLRLLDDVYRRARPMAADSGSACGP
jgi:L,D-transpeptidase YcbB